MFPYIDAEGVNGNMWSDEGAEVDGPNDAGYDYVPLFSYREDGEPVVAMTTEKAYLFRTASGSFWCPKALISTNSDNLDLLSWLVQSRFERKYLACT